MPRANRPAIQQAEYITPQDIEWIWRPYIPCGMLVMLDGDPGIGKSMTLVQIAANLSRSWAFLDQLGKPTLTPDIDWSVHGSLYGFGHIMALVRMA